MTTQSAITTRPGALLVPTLDYFLVDGSGSMKAKWWDTLAAIDAFAQGITRGHLHSHGIVNVFDSLTLSSIQRDAAISDWPPFSQSPLVSTWGGTPLYDAINLMGRSLRDLSPQSASIVIVTDGDENASRHTDAAQARALLDWIRAHPGWSLVFLGADFNNTRQALKLGANESNMISVARAKLAESGALLAQKRLAHSRNNEQISFTSDEKTTFGGYLTQSAVSQ